LGRYVRDSGTLTLQDAVRKMTLLPASDSSGCASDAREGRVQVGADADLTVFDARASWTGHVPAAGAVL